MAERLSSWYQNNRTLILISCICTLAIAAILFIFAGYIFNLTWTGFTSKSLWDWMQLLIIPVVLALGAFLLNFAMSQREQHVAMQRDKTDREIAEDNQREQLLQTYLDRMSDLLINNDLRNSLPNSEVRFIARARTLSILPKLDPNRKSILIQFLYESGLIDAKDCIISLKGANLKEISIDGAQLNHINLSGAILDKAMIRHTYLCEANLSRAQFVDAILHNVDLKGANMDTAHMVDASFLIVDATNVDLRHSNLVGTKWSNTVITNANLSEVSLIGALITGTLFNNSNLSKADLTDAKFGKGLLDVPSSLMNANLSETNLLNTDLSDTMLYQANINDAILANTKYSKEQLDKDYAKSFWSSAKEKITGRNLYESTIEVVTNYEKSLRKKKKLFHGTK